MSAQAGKRTIKSCRYVFPKMKDFRENRRGIHWEQVYGWLDGYGALFDPVVFDAIGVIPEWENGWEEKETEGEFIITSCRLASDEVGNIKSPGIFIRPDYNNLFLEVDCISEKELIRTPHGKRFYPVGYSHPLTYDRYKTGLPGWKIGENASVAIIGRDKAAVAFELFGMVGHFRDENPEEILLWTADTLAELIKETRQCINSKVQFSNDENYDVRLDFQSFGVTRLMLQWLLDKKSLSRSLLEKADTAFYGAFSLLRAGKASESREQLSSAFHEMAALRKTISPLNLFLLEFPHMGILTKEKGWFELEWPHYACKTLEQYMDWAKNYGWRFGIECGASCWKNFANRYPSTVENIKRSWKKGNLELTNGTFSLPYPLISPLLLQYWQFATGQRLFQGIFGRLPDTYQAQEHALTTQMPELLRLFKYKQALHMTQNRGETPTEKEDFVFWHSPAGHGIPAMVSRYPALSKKGINFYVDMPLIHAEHGETKKSMNYVNFMDFGNIPLRTQMVRSHSYAPVFGEYRTSSGRFREACLKTSNLAPRCYKADDYHFNLFYSDETNANAFSQCERIMGSAHSLRQLQLAAWMAGREEELHPEISSLFKEICFQEAHDVVVVQNQRRGEFCKFTEETPPYSRDTLSEEADARIKAVLSKTENIAKSIGGEKPGLLLNAAESSMKFSRIRNPGSFRGKTLNISGESYASGDFYEWSAASSLDSTLKPLSIIPDSWGEWSFAIKNNSLTFNKAKQDVSISLYDSKHGEFDILAIKAHAAEGLLVFTVEFGIMSPFVQVVVLDVIIHKQNELAELCVRYAPGRVFDPSKRYADYLAVDLQLNKKLSKVWRFNPNVHSSSVEKMLVSPYYLTVEEEHGELISFLNEGAMVYKIERSQGKIHWCFHVANENVWTRRMAFVFGKENVFQLSRAWSQGLLPIKVFPVVTPKNWLRDGWEGLSLEGFTDDGKLLISNLNNSASNFTLSSDAPELKIINVSGVSRMKPGSFNCPPTFKLEPFEIGLINFVQLSLLHNEQSYSDT